jgi:hypothetical protein
MPVGIHHDDATFLLAASMSILSTPTPALPIFQFARAHLEIRSDRRSTSRDVACKPPIILTHSSFLLPV